MSRAYSRDVYPVTCQYYCGPRSRLRACDIHGSMRLLVEIGQGMLSVGILVANSLAYDWESVFVISKAILVHARPLGSAPALHGLWRTCRRIRYSRIIHNSCAESRVGFEDRLSRSGRTCTGLGKVESHPTGGPPRRYRNKDNLHAKRSAKQLHCTEKHLVTARCCNRHPAHRLTPGHVERVLPCNEASPDDNLTWPIRDILRVLLSIGTNNSQRPASLKP
jgi:hypothetical protein